MEMLCTSYVDQSAIIVRFFENELLFNELIEAVVEDLVANLELIEAVVESLVVHVEALEEPGLVASNSEGMVLLSSINQ